MAFNDLFRDAGLLHDPQQVQAPDDAAPVAPATPQTPSQSGGWNDIFSGYVPPQDAAKAAAAGTTAKPAEAGETFSTAVKTGTPPEVVQADPEGFNKSQTDKETAKAIDDYPDIANYVASVHGAAAISRGDWPSLKDISEYMKSFDGSTVADIVQKWVSAPALDTAAYGAQQIAQGAREITAMPSPTEKPLIDLTLAKGLYHTALGAFAIGMSPFAPEFNALVKLISLTGIPEDQVAWALMGAIPGRSPARPGVVPFGKYPSEDQPFIPPEVKSAKPTGRDLWENLAGYHQEFTPEEIKNWSNEELKDYLNNKAGFGSVPTEYAKAGKTPKPGMDERLDELHVEEANTNKDTIDNLYKAVQNSNTIKMSKEAAEAYLNLSPHGQKSIWLPSDVVADMYGGQAPRPGDYKFGFIDSINERLPQANELGQEISVPLSKFLAHTPESAYGLVKDFLRMEEGLTPEEAKEWIDNMHIKPAEEEEAAVAKMTQAKIDPVAAEEAASEAPPQYHPTEYGAENFLPMKEEIEAKPGANVARLAKLLGPKLYGEPTNMDKVTVKELLQNAFDAIKGAQERGQIDKGRIHVETDTNARTIKMTDNGTGMAPGTLAKEFLEIAGTKKETTLASGGLGIAKMLLVYANKGLNVVTMRDGKVAELNTHGEALLASLQDPSLAPKIQVRDATDADKKLFPDGHGTHVEVTIPKKYKDPQTGEDKDINFESNGNWHPVIKRSPLFGNTDVSWHDRSYGIDMPQLLPDIGADFPVNSYTQFPPAKFAWGNAQIYISKAEITDNKWDENVHVLSNGLWQFSTGLKKDPLKPYGENIPHTLYIDVHPKVAPEESGYPFDLNRQGFTRDAKKSFDKVLAYIGLTYQQMDFLSQAKSYGDIQYLTPGVGKVEVSPRVQLEPKAPPTKTTMTGIGEGDKIEFRGDDMYVNGKKMPSLDPQDLAQAKIDVEGLTVEQKLIDPNKVMLHSSMEMVESGQPLDDAAREKFGPAFDEFMYEVGDTFLRLRDAIAKIVPGYAGTLKEAIGISFDREYRGVSIRVPFSGSFVNPALPQETETLLAATGTWGTMIHELAHHKVRSHGVEFEAEMAKLDAYLRGEQVKILNSIVAGGYNPQGAINALAKTFTEHREVFDWLRAAILDESRTRTRGRRIKGAGEERKPAAEERPVEGAPVGQAPVRGPTGGGPAGDIVSPTAEGRGFHINPTEQLAQVLLHAEKKSLYLAPLFKDAKSAGMTQKQWNAYSQKLENMDQEDYEKALAAARKEVTRTLTPEWQGEFNEMYKQAESDLNSRGDIAANRFFRLGELPTGETVPPLKLDRKAVEYMAGEKALQAITKTGGIHPDNLASTFGYNSGRELVGALAEFDRARGRKAPRAYIKQLTEEEANRRMAEKHGSIEDAITEAAQRIATENHHVEVLDAELKHLALKSGEIPFTQEQIYDHVNQLFARVPHKEAKFTTYSNASRKAATKAEEALLAGKFDEAFKWKLKQMRAVIAAKEARLFERFKKTAMTQFKRIADNASLPNVNQEHLDHAHNILADLGISPRYPNRLSEPFSQFVENSNGTISAAYWLKDPTAQVEGRTDFSGGPITGKQLQFDKMNVEEFEALAKTIKSLMHDGREAKLIGRIHDKADLDNVVFDILGKLDRYPDIRQPNFKNMRQTLGVIARNVNAPHLLVERMLYDIDQFDPGGPLTRYLDRPFRDSYNEEIKLKEAIARFLKSMDDLTDASIHDRINNKVILDELDSNRPMMMDRSMLRRLIELMGSRDTIEKAVNGFKVKESELWDLIASNATAQDIAWANKKWELSRHMWPRAADMLYRVTGVEAAAREPSPTSIKLSDGKTYKLDGGYAEIRYDRKRSNISTDIQGDLFDPTYVQAITPHGYTMPVTGYKGFLDLSNRYEPTRLMGAAHDIAFREAVISANKLIKRADFTMGLRQKWGTEYADLLPGWLKGVANVQNLDDSFAYGWAHAMAIVNQNAAAAMTFLSPSMWTKHLMIAAGMSAGQVGIGPISKGVYSIGVTGMVTAARDIFRDPGMTPEDNFIAAFRQVNAKTPQGAANRAFVLNSSPMMRERVRPYWDTVRGAWEYSTQPSATQHLLAGQPIRAIGRLATKARIQSMNVGRLAVSMSDAATSFATWWGEYHRHFLETGDHHEAVFMAERAVTAAHGSGFVGDRPAIMRLAKATTLPGQLFRSLNYFFTFWNHNFNNNLQLMRDMGAYFRGREEPGANIQSMFAKFVTGVLMPIVAEELARELYSKTVNDKDTFAVRLIKASIRQMGGGYWGIREMTNAFADGREPSIGLVGSELAAAWRFAKDIERFGARGEMGRNWISHLLTAISMGSGVGGATPAKAIQGLVRGIEGEERPEGPGETMQLLLHGTVQ